MIGVPDGELAKMDGNAGGIAKALVANGSLSVWQYAVRKSASGDLEQAPLHRIGLIARESLRVEPYASPLKVLPIDDSRNNFLRRRGALHWRRSAARPSNPGYVAWNVLCRTGGAA